ncbi:MAG: NAD(P)H-binding protein [Nonlabens sp.]
MSKKIGVLGCGWLGKALAKVLIQNGNSVRGTVRRENQMEDLKSLGIEPFFINLTPKKLYGEVAEFLKDLDVLIISLPPGTRKNPKYEFEESIRLFLAFVEVYRVPKIIFISSTSVFKESIEIPTYTENFTPNSTSQSARHLIAAEKLIQDFDAQTTIVRPGGLIGDDRHPVNYLAGKKNLKNPNAPVNLVNRDYLIDLIIEIIVKDLSPEFIHAISEDHESRKEYYQREAKKRSLELPQFVEESSSSGKKIESSFRINAL